MRTQLTLFCFHNSIWNHGCEWYMNIVLLHNNSTFRLSIIQWVANPAFRINAVALYKKSSYCPYCPEQSKHNICFPQFWVAQGSIHTMTFCTAATIFPTVLNIDNYFRHGFFRKIVVKIFVLCKHHTQSRRWLNIMQYRLNWKTCLWNTSQQLQWFYLEYLAISK